MDIKVNSGVVLTLEPYNDGDTNYTDDFPFILYTDTLTVDGTISSNGQGYIGGGPQVAGYGLEGGGTSAAWRASGAGAGYGGLGGNPSIGGVGGDTYGSSTEPVLLGSGGGGGIAVGVGGAGGGAIKIEADSVVVNGTGIIRANGSSGTTAICTPGYNRGHGGGGSGGSIYIVTGTMSGTGAIQANGANYTYNGHGRLIK